MYFVLAYNGVQRLPNSANLYYYFFIIHAFVLRLVNENQILVSTLFPKFVA